LAAFDDIAEYEPAFFEKEYEKLVQTMQQIYKDQE
jgi:hypothetical protein